MPKDFGDILDKWERGQKGTAGSADNNPKNSAMEAWLNKNEIYDKDADGEEFSANETHSQKYRRRLRSARPDDCIDIHGLNKDEAWLALDNFFSKAKDNGFKKLRVIHGKGNHSKGESVLSATVRAFIEKCPYAGESGYEKAVNGGTGATWVLLK